MSATLIGRLAVSIGIQRRLVGEGLLFDALKRAYFAARPVGSALTIVHAIDADAERFYKTFAFAAIENAARGLSSPLRQTRRSCNKSVALDGCATARQI